MAVGVTQPGGAGTTIFIYDDASSASGLGYTFAEIASAFPADFISNGTLKPSYRAAVSLQVGDTGVGTATTTLVDTAESTVIWDNTRTLSYRITQATSWFTSLGSKVGTGDQATGHKGTTLVFGAATTLRGTFNFYGSILKATTGLTQMLPSVAGSGEMVNCLYQSSQSAAANAFAIGGVNRLGNIFNVDVTSSNTGDVLQAIQADTVERITIGGSSYRGGMQFLTATAQTVKDVIIFGTPTRADFLWGVGTAASHTVISPVWSGSAPKFGFAGGNTATPVLAFATTERREYDVKVVDAAGAGISGIPVKLTDVLSNVQVDTTTASDGSISFGSGLTANTVVVMDHYSNGTIYVQQHRGPFLAEINTGASENPAYGSYRYYFNWPGSEGVTTNSGTFGLVSDTIPLVYAGGAPTSWSECTL